MPLYLPDRHGAYREVKLPKYMLPVFFREVTVFGSPEPLLQPRIQEAGLYRYRLVGWNHYRKDYGVTEDMEKHNWTKKPESETETQDQTAQPEEADNENGA